eukprot:jgi/Hompol1/1122/HPOL_001598-RA
MLRSLPRISANPLVRAMSNNSAASVASQAAASQVKTLVSTEWLASNLDSVKVLDCSWHMPHTKRDPHQEFLLKHVKGARFFDIDEIADTSVPLPHMLPTAIQFAVQVGELGINNDDHLVLYDTGFGACRVFWTFRAFGHRKLSVLNGGFQKWTAESRAVESGEPPKPEFQEYLSRENPHIVENYEGIIHAFSKHSAQIIDARPLLRFQGKAPEPREGIPSGHIPTSINIPSSSMYDPATNEFLPLDQLARIFAEKGVDLKRPIISSCGSGITASVLYFVLDMLGAKTQAVYDGSWTEYAAKPDCLIQKLH